MGSIGGLLGAWRRLLMSLFMDSALAGWLKRIDDALAVVETVQMGVGLVPELLVTMPPLLLTTVDQGAPRELTCTDYGRGTTSLSMCSEEESVSSCEESEKLHLLSPRMTKEGASHSCGPIVREEHLEEIPSAPPLLSPRLRSHVVSAVLTKKGSPSSSRFSLASKRSVSSATLLEAKIKVNRQIGPTRAPRVITEGLRESWSIRAIQVSGGDIEKLPKPKSVRTRRMEAAQEEGAVTLNLVATISCCEGMPKRDAMASFCVVRWEKEQNSFRTRTVFNTQTPVWNETFELPFPALPHLYVEVWNLPGQNREELLGFGSTSFEAGLPETEQTCLVDLKRPSFASPDSPQASKKGGEEQRFRVVIKAKLVEVDTNAKSLVDLLTRRQELSLAVYRFIESTKQEASGFAMVELLHTAGRAGQFLSDAIIEPKHLPALLSSDSILRKMIGVFCRYSRDPCLGLLVPILSQLQHETRSLEVRTSYLARLHPKSNAAALEKIRAENKLVLEHYAKQILVTICQAAFDVNPELRNMCSAIGEVLEHPEDRRDVMGDILFQKFFCPVIATPATFGLVSEAASGRDARLAQSNVVLAKLLGNLAGGKPFSTVHELSVMNDFIPSQLTLVDEIFNLVSGTFSAFDVVMYSTQEREQFRKFLTETHCVENLQFWEDAQQYERMSSEDRQVFGPVLMKLYIERHSEREANLNTDTVRNIKERAMDYPSDLFKTAKLEVICLLKEDSFPKFSTRRKTTTIAGQLVSSSVRTKCLTEVSRFLVENKGSLRQFAENDVKPGLFDNLDEVLSCLSIEYNPHRDVIVLNRSINWSNVGKLPRPAWPVGAFLLESIVKIYKSSFAEQASTGIITDDALESLNSSPEFLEFCNNTAELQLVKVHNLSDNQKLTFWLNTYNTLVLHAYVSVGQPNSFDKWMKLQANACYEIDSEIYSLSEIEHCVLRAAMPPSKRVASATIATQFAVGNSRIGSLLRVPVPYLAFLIANGTSAHPHLRVYHSGSCQLEIQENVLSFISNNIHLDPNTKEISVPQVFKWFAHDSGLERRKAFRILVSLLPDSEKKEVLLLVSKSPHVRINYEPPQYAFLPAFDLS